MATKTLHIVDGESTVGSLRQAGFRKMTDTGRSVLAGKADHITLNGIDRWIGGVDLLGRCVRWRWNERIRAIVSHRKLAAN